MKEQGRGDGKWEATDCADCAEPFLPQRAPTFAKATAGKQSFTEEIILKYLNVGNPLPFASSRLCVRRLFDFFMSS